MINRERARGVLVGLHLGDSLGAGFEFAPPGSVNPDHVGKKWGGGAFGWKPGEATDDTDQAIILAEVIRDGRGRFDPGELARRLVKWAKRARDVGIQTQKALRYHARAGGYDPDASLKADPRRESEGNGALVRGIPCAIVNCWSLDEAVAVAEAQASLTHSAPGAINPSAWLTAFLWAITRGFAITEALQTADSLIPGRNGWPGFTWGKSNTGHAPVTLDAAINGFELARRDGAEAGFRFVISHGSDADSAGAVFGAIAGAFFGVDSLPWVEKLQRAAECLRLADCLAEL